jgi:hypothetical protein
VRCKRLLGKGFKKQARVLNLFPEAIDWFQETKGGEDMRLFLALPPVRRVYWLLIAVLVVAIFLLLWARGPQLEGTEVGRRAQEELQRTASYRFDLTIRTLIDGQEAVVSAVSGDFVRPDTFCLYGRSYDYDLHLYRLNGQLVFRDPVDGEWKEAEAGPNLVAEAVNLTTSPLADFLAASEFDLLGRERVARRECYRLKSSLAEVSNEYWRLFFTDFDLECWVDASTFKLQKISLLGANREVAEDRLEIELCLRDHDAPIDIKFPPGIQRASQKNL